jgi:hypothetical protein
VLAVAALSSLALLFVYALALAAMCRLALDQLPSRRLLPFGHQESRLYAALLRFALLMSLLIILVCVIGAQLGRYLPDLRTPFATAATVGMLLLALRLGFLLPAIAMAAPQGVVLRKSWALSRGAVPRLLVVAIAMVLPGLALEAAGELLGRALQLSPSRWGANTIQAHIELFNRFLPFFSVLLSVSILLVLALQAIASVTAYRALANGSPADGHAR